MRPDTTPTMERSGADGMRGPPLLGWVGSIRLTLPALVALAIGVAVAYDRHGEGEATWPLVFPLGLLALNLIAAITANRAFRRQTALLVFHLALLAIVLLVAAGRLTYLRGATEVTSGAAFESLAAYDAGPWHAGRMADVSFVNQGFTIRYSPGRTREETINRVAWRDESGLPRHGEIGDQLPLVIHGYRFYTTHNKGFAPLLIWRPFDGKPVRGSVHLPAFPLNEAGQEQHWRIPGDGQPVFMMLRYDEALLDPARHDVFRTPERHSLVVRQGERRAELRPGESMTLPLGVMTYEGLGTWMGYAVFYDWTLPWLLAACALAVLAMAWHFRDKYFARPWSAAD